VALKDTMADYRRDKAKEYFKALTAEERQQFLQGFAVKERLEGLSLEKIAKYLKGLQSAGTARKGKPRRKS
jgi:hypothetical protein